MSQVRRPLNRQIAIARQDLFDVLSDVGRQQQTRIRNGTPHDAESLQQVGRAFPEAKRAGIDDRQRTVLRSWNTGWLKERQIHGIHVAENSLRLESTFEKGFGPAR